MGEQPKPITQLATPVDRRGPRGRNRLGSASLTVAVLTWIAAIFVLLVGMDAIKGRSASEVRVGMLVLELWFLVVTPGAGLAAVFLGVFALVRSRDRYLDYGKAITGLIFALAGLALWWVLFFGGFVDMLGRYL
jgi:hypothetical protein